MRVVPCRRRRRFARSSSRGTFIGTIHLYIYIDRHNPSGLETHIFIVYNNNITTRLRVQHACARIRKTGTNDLVRTESIIIIIIMKILHIHDSPSTRMYTLRELYPHSPFTGSFSQGPSADQLSSRVLVILHVLLGSHINKQV